MKEPKELSQDELVVLRKYIVNYMLIYPINVSLIFLSKMSFSVIFTITKQYSTITTIENCQITK